MNALETLKDNGIEPLDIHKNASGINDPATIASIPRQIEAIRAGLYLHYGVHIIDNDILGPEVDLRVWSQAKNGRWSRFADPSADHGAVIKQFYMLARVAYGHVQNGNSDKAIPAGDPAQIAAIAATGAMLTGDEPVKPQPTVKAAPPAPAPAPKRSGWFSWFRG